MKVRPKPSEAYSTREQLAGSHRGDREHRVARGFPKDHLLDRAGFGKHNRELQDRATRYSSPSSDLRASRRGLLLSKCFERVTDKIMAISERNVRVPLRAVMVVGRVAHL